MLSLGFYYSGLPPRQVIRTQEGIRYIVARACERGTAGIIAIIVTVSQRRSVSPARYARNADLPRNRDFVLARARASARSWAIKSRRFQAARPSAASNQPFQYRPRIDTNAIGKTAFSRGLESARAHTHTRGHPSPVFTAITHK